MDGRQIYFEHLRSIQVSYVSNTPHDSGYSLSRWKEVGHLVHLVQHVLLILLGLLVRLVHMIGHLVLVGHPIHIECSVTVPSYSSHPSL